MSQHFSRAPFPHPLIKPLKTSNTPGYTLCDLKFGEKWAHAETNGSGMCPTNGDLTAMQARITSDAADVAACLNGACPPSCGDGTANGAESCDGGDLPGQSCATLGFASGTLACTAGCGFDVSGCVPASSSCGDNVINGSDSCDGPDLGGATCSSLGYTLGGTLGCTAGCGYDVSGCQSQSFPATGQTTSYGPGSDGDVQAGAALAYTDNEVEHAVRDHHVHRSVMYRHSVSLSLTELGVRRTHPLDQSQAIDG